MNSFDVQLVSNYVWMFMFWGWSINFNCCWKLRNCLDAEINFAENFCLSKPQRKKTESQIDSYHKDCISAQNDGRELSMPPKQRNPSIWFIWSVFQNIWNIWEIFEKLLQILKTYCLQKNFNFQLTLITKYIVFYSFDL